MGIKQLYNDNLRKLPNEYGDVSVMLHSVVNKCMALQNEVDILRKGFLINNTSLVVDTGTYSVIWKTVKRKFKSSTEDIDVDR